MSAAILSCFQRPVKVVRNAPLLANIDQLIPLWLRRAGRHGQCVCRTADPFPTPSDGMGVTHRHGHTRVARQFLDGSRVTALSPLAKGKSLEFLAPVRVFLERVNGFQHAAVGCGV